MIISSAAIHLPRLYQALGMLRIQTGAFRQLTRQYMADEFNPNTLDREDVRYFSYGASVEPALWSAFRQSHRIVEIAEGSNDGLVSVASSKWGDYKGTLVNVSHLDLINWTNRLRWLVWEMTGNKRNVGSKSHVQCGPSTHPAKLTTDNHSQDRKVMVSPVSSRSIDTDTCNKKTPSFSAIKELSWLLNRLRRGEGVASQIPSLADVASAPKPPEDIK
ncbi:MAG: hypothetical protein Q9207_003321 [Kuettlingeria erythrocarpa]